jgi:hypothetical protein
MIQELEGAGDFLDHVLPPGLLVRDLQDVQPLCAHEDARLRNHATQSGKQQLEAHAGTASPRTATSILPTSILCIAIIAIIERALRPRAAPGQRLGQDARRDLPRPTVLSGKVRA